jgi:hypothetical protein
MHDAQSKGFLRDAFVAPLFSIRQAHADLALGIKIPEVFRSVFRISESTKFVQLLFVIAWRTASCQCKAIPTMLRRPMNKNAMVTQASRERDFEII